MRGVVTSLVLLACSAVAAAGAEYRLDYSGQVDAEGAVVASQLAKSTVWALPKSVFSPEPMLVGREWSTLEVAPTWNVNGTDYGVVLGLFSNENTGNIGRRGVAPIDSYNFRLTRVEPQTPLDFNRLAAFENGPYGRFELGWGSGVSARTAVTAPHDFGLGGWAGDLPYFLDKPRDMGPTYYSALGSDNTSPRLLYLSPRIANLRVGASFQPDTRDSEFQFVYGGTAMGVLGRQPTTTGTYEAMTVGFTNVFEGGIDYDGRSGDTRLQASFAQIHGTAIQSPTIARFNNLDSQQVGLAYGTGEWTLGGGGVWSGRSGMTTAPVTPKRLYSFDAGLGLQWARDKWIAGASFLYGNDVGDPAFRSDRQLHVYSVGTTYKYSKDIDLGLEFDRVQTGSAVFADYANYVGLARVRYHFGNEKTAGE